MKDFQMLAKDIKRISGKIALTNDDRDDLRQEMICRLLSLPSGQKHSFYRKSCRNAAINYWARNIMDAPITNKGRVKLEHKMIFVGGLADLNRVKYGEAA